MGQAIAKIELKRLKEFILREHTDISPPLIYTKVGKTTLKGIEQYEGQKVYVVEIEKIDCDPQGQEQERINLVMRYVIKGEDVMSLEEHKARQKAARKRSRKGKAAIF